MNKFGFKDLLVWQRAIDFADQVIDLTENLNSNNKHFRLIEQTESAVASIAQIIAEGKGRRTNKEFTQFLYFSRGSLNEVVTLLNLFSRRNWISEVYLEKLENEAHELASMLKGLINSLNK